jgi:glycosyltransferase involved in cell wall biosynthesis
MKVLMISTDRRIFESDSEVRGRMLEYGGLAEELHIVVFGRAADPAQMAVGEGNVFIYPTNSRRRLMYIWDAVRIGREIIRDFDFRANDSLITVQDPFETGLAGYFLKRLTGVRLQVQMHTDFLSPHFAAESRLNWLRVRIAKLVIPRADALRAVSTRIKERVVAECGVREEKIAVLPVFVDVKNIQEAPVRIDLHKKYPQFDFLVFTAARITREKNLGLLLQALAEMNARGRGVGLVIVGDGPELASLKLKTKYLHLEGSVYFEPWSPDLASYYKTADAFVLASNYEGYGRTIVEACAAECPVVMTDVGLAGELIVDGVNGLVVPVGDSTAFREAILRLVASPNLATRLAKNARSAVFGLPDKATYLARYRAGWEACLE